MCDYSDHSIILLGCFSVDIQFDVYTEFEVLPKQASFFQEYTELLLLLKAYACTVFFYQFLIKKDFLDINIFGRDICFLIFVR